jgi:hypothetical protein
MPKPTPDAPAPRKILTTPTALKVRGVSEFLASQRRKARRPYLVPSPSTPTSLPFRLHLERRKADDFLAGILHLSEHSIDFNREHGLPLHARTITIKTRSGKPDESIPDGAEIELPAWRHLPEADKAMLYHVALLKDQAPGQRVYVFTVRFGETLLAHAFEQDKPVQWLTDHTRRHLDARHYFVWEWDGADPRTLHCHGAALAGSREELKRRLDRASRWTTGPAVNVQTPYNAANWAAYAAKIGGQINGEHAVRVDQETTQTAKALYDGVASGFVLVNRHHPGKRRSATLAAMKLTQSKRFASTPDLLRAIAAARDAILNDTDPEAAILPFTAPTATPTRTAPAPTERPTSRDTAPTLTTLPAHGFNALGVAGAGTQIRAPPCCYRVTPSTGRALPDNGRTGTVQRDQQTLNRERHGITIGLSSPRLGNMHVPAHRRALQAIRKTTKCKFKPSPSRSSPTFWSKPTSSRRPTTALRSPTGAIIRSWARSSWFRALWSPG